MCEIIVKLIYVFLPYMERQMDVGLLFVQGAVRGPNKHLNVTQLCRRVLAIGSVYYHQQGSSRHLQLCVWHRDIFVIS